LIVDFHTHVFSPDVARNRSIYAARDPWFAQLYQSPRARLASAEDLIETMDADGVDVSVVCGFGWSHMSLCVEHNDYVAEAISRHPSRLVGFAALQPRAGDAAVAEIERCVRLGFRGVGELMPDGQGFSLSDKHLLAPVVEAATALHTPLLVHSSEPVGHSYSGKGTAFPDALYRFALDFPNATIVCAHWGGGLPFYELMPEVAESARNVYYDSAASSFLYRPDVFGCVAKIVGAHKILFATDFPLVRPRKLIRQIREQKLSEEDAALVLGGNACRLLGLLPGRSSE
jgi:uncharacterized protein